MKSNQATLLTKDIWKLMAIIRGNLQIHKYMENKYVVTISGSENKSKETLKNFSTNVNGNTTDHNLWDVVKEVLKDVYRDKVLH